MYKINNSHFRPIFVYKFFVLTKSLFEFQILFFFVKIIVLVNESNPSILALFCVYLPSKNKNKNYSV